jgi:hypothetical protein
MMDSPLFKGGLAKEGDRVEVPIQKKAIKVQRS